MHIDKQQIIELLKDRGDHDQATQAQSNLPDSVDTDQDFVLLSKFDVNPADLLGGAGGGIGDKIGF